MVEDTQRELTAEAFIERYGHDWTSAEKVHEYVERSDRQATDRAEGFALMAAFAPFERDQQIRILDIGSGQGTVAAALLDAFPHAQAVGLDISEPMMQIAMERMARYGGRFQYCLGDFADGALPGDLPRPFEIAVASRSIHHLPAENKRRLYREIFDSLMPGGCFFNLDTVAPSDEGLRAIYRQASRALRERRGGDDPGREGWPDRGARPEGWQGLPGHYYDTAEAHLGFLAEAGFAPVDCFFKRMNNALIGGYKS